MSEQAVNEIYIGDGLYASFDGFSLWLRAPREHGDHYVALEPQMFADFVAFAQQHGFKVPVARGEIARCV
jgi:hypothetical protein